MNLTLSLFPLGWQHYLLGGLFIGAGVALLFVLTGLVGGMSTVFSSTWSFVVRRPFFQQARFTDSRGWRLVYALGLVLGALVWWLGFAGGAPQSTSVPVWQLLAGGFLLTTRLGEKIYLAGDTGVFGDMSLIGQEGLNLATLPIGGLYTMDPVDALQAVKLLKPHVVIPIHYNSVKSLQQDAALWKQQVEQETESHVVVLRPGEGYKLE